MTTPSTDYRLIPLTRGQFATVDFSDYEWLMQWKWYARWNPHTKSFYAQRPVYLPAGKQGTVQMHRQLLGLEKGDVRQGDHESCDTLDNRRTNLRIATIREQEFNRRKRATNKSGYKGVIKTPGSSTWMASITVDRKQIYLGSRKTKEEAYALYCEASQKYHGSFGRTI